MSKAQPHDIESEQGLIACCLHGAGGREVLGNCIEIGFTAEYFYNSRHKVIFDALIKLHRLPDPIDEIVLLDHLRKQGTEEEAGGIEGIYAIQSRIQAPIHSKLFTSNVEHCYLRRKYIRSMRKSVEDAYDPSKDLNGLITSGEIELRKMEDALTHNGQSISANGIWDVIATKATQTPYVDLMIEPIENDFRAFLKNVPIAEDGDLIVLSARLKSFKSSVVAALACAAFQDDSADCLGFRMKGNGVFLIFDTEQSENEILSQAKAMRKRLCVTDLDELIKIIRLREFAPDDRLAMIKNAIIENFDGGIIGIAVDGAADLGGSVNDDENATNIVNFLTVAASHANAPLFGVIHLNHGDRDAAGGGRGHLGKEMERKAKSVICIEKSNDGTGVIYAATTRRKTISKDQGQRIEFCEEKHMVVSIEGTRQDVKNAEKVDELRELLYRIQDETGALGWTRKDFVSIIKRIIGKSEKTAKRRANDMVEACLLRVSRTNGNVVSQLGDRTNTEIGLLTAV